MKIYIFAQTIYYTCLSIQIVKFMKKNKLITALVVGASCLGLFANTPMNMQVWLKNGEQQVYEIDQIDSVTFGVIQQEEFKPLNDWTFLPESNRPVPLSLSNEQMSYVHTGNDFAKKSFSLITQSRGAENVFYSPISLQIALGLCANGASSKGAVEIANTLGFQGDNSVEEMNQYFNSVILSLNSPIDSVILKVNNAIWPVMGAIVKPSFLDVARDQYYATVRHLDYVNEPMTAKDTIDKWAALMTNDCIKKLSIVIDNMTTLVINNACYFKAGWHVDIRNGMTQSDTFTTISGNKQIVDMMHTEDMYFYTQTDDYQMVELLYGYKNERLSNNGMGSYSMLLFLPSEGKDLDETFDSINWDSISLQRAMVDLKFPRFGIKSSISLVDNMKEMGISNIFSSFPFAVNMGSVISDIVQDTYIQVDEDGTEAAAVTSIVAAGSALPSNIANMKVNRPFGFVIREKTTGMLLFMGKVTNVKKVSKEE